MFESFFPRPKWFFLSAAIWTAIAVAGWYLGASSLGAYIGLPPMAEGQQPPIGLGHFMTPDFLWFYIYFAVFAGLFGGFWHLISRGHKWLGWSIWGSIYILFNTYFNVQVSVALNNWNRPFGDTLQKALTGDSSVAPTNMYQLLWVFSTIAFVAISVSVLRNFIVSHYVFRWRTAMNDFYVSKWPELRHIEGASQRIQEDTMNFAQIAEGLGVSMVDAVMTLIAFLPILFSLSSYVTELPIIGEIPAPLFNMAIFWSLFGTVLLAVVGIKLPGLNFKNQRVEAAYRKELVYGEDHDNRAEPATLKELFGNVRKNYFRMYYHYLYFNIAKYMYLNADYIFAFFIMVPSIFAGKITYGIFRQITSAFGQVSGSFQFLVNSWSTIITLLSVYKRLRSFEATLRQQPLPDIDQDYIANPTER